MNNEPIRHSRESILEALLNGRRKLLSYLRVRTESDLRSKEEYRLLFGLIQTSAQKETEFERDLSATDVRMDELIPPHLRAGVATQLRDVGISTMQDLLSASNAVVAAALIGEPECLQSYVFAMKPASIAMSYSQYLSSLEATDNQFIVRH